MVLCTSPQLKLEARRSLLVVKRLRVRPSIPRRPASDRRPTRPQRDDKLTNYRSYLQQRLFRLPLPLPSLLSHSCPLSRGQAGCRLGTRTRTDTALLPEKGLRKGSVANHDRGPLIHHRVPKSIKVILAENEPTRDFSISEVLQLVSLSAVPLRCREITSFCCQSLKKVWAFQSLSEVDSK